MTTGNVRNAGDTGPGSEQINATNFSEVFSFSEPNPRQLRVSDLDDSALARSISRRNARTTAQAQTVGQPPNTSWRPRTEIVLGRAPVYRFLRSFSVSGIFLIATTSRIAQMLVNRQYTYIKPYDRQSACTRCCSQTRPDR